MEEIANYITLEKKELKKMTDSSVEYAGPLSS